MLLVLALLAWAASFLQSDTMMMDMAMFQLDLPALALFASTWTVGMVAMMFPTAVPMMMLFLSVGRKATVEIKAGGGPTLTKAALFIASYIAVWALVGILFYALLASLAGLPNLGGFLDAIASPVGVGVALLLVGVYQLSPVKGECLDRCHPTNFLFKYYRGGRLGAAEMGILYAKYCVGCCWVMMLFLLLVGAMGPLWMVVFAALIFMERAVMHGRWPPKLIGVAFLSLGAARLLLI